MVSLVNDELLVRPSCVKSMLVKVQDGLTLGWGGQQRRRCHSKASRQKFPAAQIFPRSQVLMCHIRPPLAIGSFLRPTPRSTREIFSTAKASPTNAVFRLLFATSSVSTSEVPWLFRAFITAATEPFSVVNMQASGRCWEPRRSLRFPPPRSARALTRRLFRVMR